jgi:hypothetical protein
VVLGENIINNNNTHSIATAGVNATPPKSKSNNLWAAGPASGTVNSSHLLISSKNQNKN